MMVGLIRDRLAIANTLYHPTRRGTYTLTTNRKDTWPKPHFPFEIRPRLQAFHPTR
jgi:hypothetical protein